MKKILLILLILLLTGCKATYNISFDEKNINESIKIYTNNSNIENANQKTIDKVSDELYNFEYDYEYYNKEKYQEGNNTGYNYTYSFDYDTYNLYTELKKCYDDFNYSNGDYTTLKTSNEFTCFNYYPEIEEITINITSKYEITEANADQKDGNTYTWIINQKNYKNKPINIRINKKKEYKENKVNNKLIITFSIFIILILILLFMKKKTKKDNH